MDAGKKRGGWTFQKILGYFLQFMSFELLEKLENGVFSYMKFKKYDFRQASEKIMKDKAQLYSEVCGRAACYCAAYTGTLILIPKAVLVCHQGKYQLKIWFHT